MPEIVSRLSRAFNSAVQAYNPCSSHVNAGLGVAKVWSQVLVKKLEVSMIRFRHYVESPDLIKSTEIAQYRKEWMAKAL